MRDRIALLRNISRQKTVYVAQYRENIVDHVSVLAIATYLLIRSYYVLVCLSTHYTLIDFVFMFVAYFLRSIV